MKLNTKETGGTESKSPGSRSAGLVSWRLIDKRRERGATGVMLGSEFPMETYLLIFIFKDASPWHCL